MTRSALELTPLELQEVTMSDADIARAVAMAVPTNEKVLAAADARLRFEDEPAHYLALLAQHAMKQR